jgi:RNA polymerase sigma factor (TIGR02999 family)
MSDPERVTRLLRDWAEGNQEAREQVLPLVYETLRRLARRYLQDERHAGTLQPTALVHEAYVRLVENHPQDWESRHHFYGVAARLMRQILVDHARARLSARRGGGAVKVELDTDLPIAAQGQGADVLALNDALEALAGIDRRKTHIIDLRYFGGFTEEETARSLQISVATVRRQTRLAEAWLYAHLHPGDRM